MKHLIFALLLHQTYSCQNPLLPDHTLADLYRNSLDSTPLPCLKGLIRLNKFAASTEAIKKLEDIDVETAI